MLRAPLNIDALTLDPLISEAEQKLATLRPELIPLFRNCFPNTLRTTVEILDDGGPFVITGDIPAMWLRDSSAQLRPYVTLASSDAGFRQLIKGVIQRQAQQIALDGYANAFNKTSNGQGHQQDRTDMSPWVWERKFELDSLCYPVRLCWDYWQVTQDKTVFDSDVHHMLRRIVNIMRVEQHHDTQSSYLFERDDCLLPSDTLPFDGKGTRTNFTGMVWSGFRPSDDACKFGFHIPSNMFATVILEYIAQFAKLIYQDRELRALAKSLQAQIRFGIETYGIVDHPRVGKMYAYETDGYGNYNLMDDANIPSLLSIPYLDYCTKDAPVYRNTRAFVLSDANPYYYSGKYARGVGSPHTPGRHIWPLGLIMQGLTAVTLEEMNEILDMLLHTTDGTHYMHESFDPDNPSEYSRSWFAWANSLLSELILEWLKRTENQL
jgi:meiotically up-regulated gene 157 (Mug157) protein